MIKILGRKRIIFITVLTLLFCGLALLWTQYLEPMRMNAESAFNSANSALETKRADIARLKKEFVFLKNQISQFKEMESIGFFNDQNRVLAQETLDSFRQTSGVIKANYTVASGEEIANDAAKSINHSIIKSPIIIDVESIDDNDFYNFVKLVLEQFPGRNLIQSIDLSQETKLTQKVLKDISSGEPLSLMKGQIKFNWYSMKKNEDPSAASPEVTPATAGAAQ